jgi:predicted DCC family thiol-disulfide oxidoreductase YuxK
MISENYILYDGECPVCKNYIAFMNLKKNFGVQLLNARFYPELVQFYRDKNMDINDGFLLKLDDKIYYGSDCINKITSLGNSKNYLTNMHDVIFSSKLVSKLFYPIFVVLRKILLFILNIKKI